MGYCIPNGLLHLIYPICVIARLQPDEWYVDCLVQYQSVNRNHEENIYSCITRMVMQSNHAQSSFFATSVICPLSEWSILGGFNLWTKGDWENPHMARDFPINDNCRQATMKCNLNLALLERLDQHNMLPSSCVLF